MKKQRTGTKRFISPTKRTHQSMEHTWISKQHLVPQILKSPSSLLYLDPSYFTKFLSLKDGNEKKNYSFRTKVGILCIFHGTTLSLSFKKIFQILGI